MEIFGFFFQILQLYKEKDNIVTEYSLFFNFSQFGEILHPTKRRVVVVVVQLDLHCCKAHSKKHILSSLICIVVKHIVKSTYYLFEECLLVL
jgi:hypothetical protein